MFRQLWSIFLRFAYHQFYNPFAFTYDWVSAFISRGHWRTWTRAAIPHLVGRRVLEIPCGTGNLLLDLHDTGYAPIGVDLSPTMLGITQAKLRRAKIDPPILRARAQALPFATGAFDCITMTFPPSFVYDPSALAELQRVLRDDGRLVWVDGGRLLPRDLYSRLLNRAFDAVTRNSQVSFSTLVNDVLGRAGFETKVETVHDDASTVTVVIATK